MTDNEEVRAMIERKTELDQRKQFIETHRWLIDAVELLLRIQIRKEKETHK
jgi:hypothetical protein